MFTKEMADQNREMTEHIRDMIDADMSEADMINTLIKQYPQVAIDRIRRQVDKANRQRTSPYYSAEQLTKLIPQARGKEAPITRQAVHNLAKKRGWFTAYRGLYNKKMIDEYLEKIQ